MCTLGLLRCCNLYYEHSTGSDHRLRIPNRYHGRRYTGTRTHIVQGGRGHGSTLTNHNRPFTQAANLDGRPGVQVLQAVTGYSGTCVLALQQC